MCIYVDVCMYMCVNNIYMYVCTCICTCVCACMYVYICVSYLIFQDIFLWFMCFIDIFNSSYFALLCKSLLTITIAILITEMNCVFTDHDYFSCYKHDVSLCFLESRIIAVSANVFCWLYPTINKVYLILSYLILLVWESPLKIAHLI